MVGECPIHESVIVRDAHVHHAPHRDGVSFHDDRTLLNAAESEDRDLGLVPRLSTAAKLLKTADAICNISDILHDPPMGWALERRRDYFSWSEQVIMGCRGTSPALEEEYDRQLARGREVLGE